MRSTASYVDTAATIASDEQHGISTHTRLAVAMLGFAAVMLASMAVYPKSAPATIFEPKFACATIDWRVGEKLAALQGSQDARTRTIVNSMTQQRDTASAHCRAGNIDDAMALYGLTDRALTRYVSYGTGATLPK